MELTSRINCNIVWKVEQLDTTPITCQCLGLPSFTSREQFYTWRLGVATYGEFLQGRVVGQPPTFGTSIDGESRQEIGLADYFKQTNRALL